MKFTVLCFFALVALAASRPDGEHYTDKYDGTDIKELLSNERLVEGYVLCMLGTGRCNAEGKELKSHLQEALETGCAKCTTVQQQQSRVVIAHLINKTPNHWNALKQKYDPSGKYSAKYESELRTLKS